MVTAPDEAPEPSPTGERLDAAGDLAEHCERVRAVWQACFCGALCDGDLVELRVETKITDPDEPNPVLLLG